MKQVMLFIAAILGTINCSAQLSFAPAVHYTGLGDKVYSVVSGDFNIDGNVDIACSNHTSRSVSIFRGDGRGSFAPPLHTYLAGSDYITSIATADFNKDGTPDLVVGKKLTDTLNVLFGDGTGSFPMVANYQIANNAKSITTADVNNDGNTDIITASAGHGGYFVSVLLNNGTGGFQAATHYPVTGSTFRIVCSDFDNDNKKDIATANYSEGGVNLLSGNGNGSFSQPVSFATGYGTNSICAVDLDKDGNMDIITADANPPNVSAVTVLMGDGLGGFASPVQFNGGNDPHSVISDDFNSDNKPDVAVANVSSGSISVLPGNGNGSFASALNLPIGKTPSCIINVDLNKDGKMDIISGNFDSSDLTVLLNTSPTSVDPNVLTTETNIRVFPNPCHGTFQIVSSKSEIETVVMFNVLGKKVFTVPVPADSIIHTDGIPKGVYFLHMLRNNKTVHTEKILLE